MAEPALTGEPTPHALCVLGIDPGLTGALAYYFPDAADRCAVIDMPEMNGEADPHAIERSVAQMAPAFAVVERQGPRPTDGCKQTFGISGAYFTVRTVLALRRIPLHLVTPSVWKRHHGLIGAADPKAAARALASRLFPQTADHFRRVKDHNRADAALIARFGANTISG